MGNPGEESMAAALKPFGWTCTQTFWDRYYRDAWVFNLANAVEALTKKLEGLEAGGVDTRERCPHGCGPIIPPDTMSEHFDRYHWIDSD